jgi:hypothetical protein
MTTRVENVPLLMSIRLVTQVTKLMRSPAELILALADNSEAFDSLTHAVKLLSPTVPAITQQNMYDAIRSLDSLITALEHQP